MTVKAKEWKSDTEYKGKEIVIFNDKYYTSLIGERSYSDNIDKQPNEFPVYWSEL